MTIGRPQAAVATAHDGELVELLPDMIRSLSASVAPPIAALDLDNTLLDGDIGEALFAQLVNRGIIREFGWKAYADLLQIKRSAAYRRVVTAMEGLAVEDVRQVVRGILESPKQTIEWRGNSVRVPRANAYMRSLVDDLLRRGWEVYVISASCQVAAEMASETLLGIKADHVHGIQTRIVEGRYTGELLEPVPIGSGKSDLYEQTLNLPAPVLTAGDSILDLPLMNLTSPNGISLWCGEEDFDIVRRNLSPRTVYPLPARLRSKLQYQPSDSGGTLDD